MMQYQPAQATGWPLQCKYIMQVPLAFVDRHGGLVVRSSRCRSRSQGQQRPRERRAGERSRGSNDVAPQDNEPPYAPPPVPAVEQVNQAVQTGPTARLLQVNWPRGDEVVTIAVHEQALGPPGYVTPRMLERHLQAVYPQMAEPYSRLGFMVGDRPSFGRALRTDVPMPPEYWGCRDTIYVVPSRSQGGYGDKMKKGGADEVYKDSLVNAKRCMSGLLRVNQIKFLLKGDASLITRMRKVQHQDAQIRELLINTAIATA